MNKKLRKIVVYGNLRKFLGRSHFEAAVNSPQQAFNFLKANFQGIEKHMNQQIYKIRMGNRIVTEDLLSVQGEGDIKIIPVAVGGIFGFFKDVAGFIGDFVSDAFNFVTDNLLTLGLAFVTGGVSELVKIAALGFATDLLSQTLGLTNQSAVGDTDPSIRGSYSFSGIQNVANSGVPVPILYGLVYSGSIIISAGTDTAQIVKKIS
jgi:predicted phage tail protein|tara:strand:+ start:497 stop:1114 length:618 start_codon:yes stop_codon:yes gene_type:complete